MADPIAPHDLSDPRRIHVVGAGGAGMSAIATVLAGMGHRVSGSDLKASSSLERLEALGASVHVGHRAEHVAGAELVTVSSAIPDSNPEVVAARLAGVPVLSRAEILAAIAAVRRTVAVAGTHGKTTTASMLALALTEAGMRPSFVIGGDLNEIGTGAAWSDGQLLVVEADESDGTFLALGADAAVVTNVEPDHLEHYGDFAALRAAFEEFVAGVPGPRILCADDPGSGALADALRGRGLEVTTYGVHPDSDFCLVADNSARTGTDVAIHHRGDRLVSFRLPVPGLHNARNAAAALAAAVTLGADPARCATALARFGGVARRYEFRGEAAGVAFVDDYAHLPTEVAAALAAAGSGDWRRVVCVFQPHRYSRTEALWATFAGAFDGADLLVVTDVYASGEAPRPGVTGKLVLNAVLDAHPWRRAAYLPHRQDLVEFLRSELRPGDLCLTLGAGDLTTLADELRSALEPEVAA